MIESLHLEGIAVVEKADLELGPGLNVLTGETGAGKSIILGALSLLVGGKARAETLREGCDTGRVEAVFATRDKASLEKDLVRLGLECEDDKNRSLVVGRTLQRAGRSRARVGGQLVPVAVLAELFAGRVEISSQRESHALLRPESHGRALDAAGDLLELRAAVAKHHGAVLALCAEGAALRKSAEERAREQDFLRFQCDEIDAADLRKDQWDQLGTEHARLAHAERLKAEGGNAVASLAGDPGSGGEGAALHALDRAAQTLGDLGRLDPDLAALALRMEGAATEVRDTVQDLERYVDRIEIAPGRLEVIEEQLAQLESLRRKYGKTVEAVLAHRERVGGELDRLGGQDDRAGEIEALRDAQWHSLRDSSAELSKGRAAAALQLATKLEAALHDLGLPEAGFRVALEPRAPLAGEPEEIPSGPQGAEHPVFYFTANAGVSPKPIQKVASGGELSRLFLALKNVLRRDPDGMLLVFDEVDAGIGGRLAERVGRVLAELATRHQVLCITHLPQIAALADAHFRVEKVRRGGRTRTQVERIEGPARVEEVARMAGGEKVTEATRRHARELLRAR